jgi:proteasome accessory factor B
MERVNRTERLLNLVIALMATQQPMPRASIRQQIPGYDGNDAAFERKFERDKDELRSMGIPLQTFMDAGGEVQGYRILSSEYALPDLELSHAERTALSLAAHAWRDAVAGPLAGQALLKLDSAMDPHLRSDQLPAHLTAREAALLPLMAALRTQRDVTFAYQRADEDRPTTRSVSPWGLRVGQGAWYLVGFDHDREDVRTFRLSRIRDAVDLAGTPRRCDPPASFDLNSDASAEQSITASLSIADGQAVSLRRRSQPSTARGRYDISASDLERLATDVCAASSGVVVLSPPELVAQVRQSLDDLIAAHTDTP